MLQKCGARAEREKQRGLAQTGGDPTPLGANQTRRVGGSCHARVASQHTRSASIHPTSHKLVAHTAGPDTGQGLPARGHRSRSAGATTQGTGRQGVTGALPAVPFPTANRGAAVVAAPGRAINQRWHRGFTAVRAGCSAPKVSNNNKGKRFRQRSARAAPRGEPSGWGAVQATTHPRRMASPGHTCAQALGALAATLARSTACAAARRAMGTRRGLQLT